jgi:hypothetical protein
LLYGWQVIGTWMMTITAVLMGFMALFLWVSWRPHVLLMAVASLAHSVRLVLSVLAEPPCPSSGIFSCTASAFTVYCGFFCTCSLKTFLA